MLLTLKRYNSSSKESYNFTESMEANEDDRISIEFG